MKRSKPMIPNEPVSNSAYLALPACKGHFSTGPVAYNMLQLAGRVTGSTHTNSQQHQIALVIRALSLIFQQKYDFDQCGQSPSHSARTYSLAGHLRVWFLQWA